MKTFVWRNAFSSIALIASLGFTASAHANCNKLPNYNELTNALKQSVDADNGGFGLDMWATIVDRDGRVCQVTMSGDDRGDQWPGSRVISAQKAHTANAFSLPGLALSTANLWAATQPGGSLFGLQHSNPVDAAVAYGNGNNHGGGSAARYGMPNDPMKGKFIGGVNVFGGGLALYDEEGTLLGAVGVSGDSSCADHNIAWRVRESLMLDNVPGGVSSENLDQIIYDTENGFGHPTCGLNEVLVSEEIGAAPLVNTAF